MLDKNRLIYYLLIGTFLQYIPTNAVHFSQGTIIPTKKSTSRSSSAKEQYTDFLNTQKTLYFYITDRSTYAPFNFTIYNNADSELQELTDDYENTKNFLSPLDKIRDIELRIQKTKKLLALLNHPCLNSVRTITQSTINDAKNDNSDCSTEIIKKNHFKKKLAQNVTLLKKTLKNIKKKDFIAQIKQQEQQLKLQYNLYIDIKYKETLTKLLPLVPKSKFSNSKEQVIYPIDSISITNKLNSCNKRIKKALTQSKLFLFYKPEISPI